MKEFFIKKYHKYKIIFYNNSYKNKLKFINQNDILICDTPFGIDKNLKIFCNEKKINKVILIDDINKPKIKNCLILNGIISFKKKLKKNSKNFIFEGPKYVLLDKKYQNIKNKSKKNILISVGGTDIKNLLYKIVKKLKKINIEKIFVIIGGLVKKNNPIFSINQSNIKFIYNPPSLWRYFNQCKTCIVTGGITMFESIALKKNTLVVQNYHHQKYAINYFNKLGLIRKVGTTSKLNSRLINQYIQYKRISVKKRFIDGKGLTRITSKIKKYLDK